MPVETAVSLPPRQRVCADVRVLGTHSRVSWWLWPHLLSLDAPLVAVTWQVWWARSAKVALAPCDGIVLGLSVWLIYLADRLADTARADPGDHATARHAFSARRRVSLFTLCSVIGGVLIVLAPCVLPHTQFAAGLGLLGLAAGYFWMIHRGRSQAWTAFAPKEAIVGAMFAVGSAFFIFCRRFPSGTLLLSAVAGFGVLCFLNCALITRWERNAQDDHNPASLPNAFPQLTAHGLGPLCWLLAAITAAAGWRWQTAVFLPVAASGMLLGLLDRCRGRFTVHALRVLADAALLTPCFYLCLLPPTV